MRLAEIYGPFVRFFPGGSEDPAAGDNDNPISDADAAAAAIKEAEPKIEDSPQFKGLLRDRQADRVALAETNARLAAETQERERLQRQIEDGKKTPDDFPELSEEEAREPVNMGELHNILRSTSAKLGKNIVENVTKILDVRETKASKASLQKQQSADAKALMQTHTAETKGQALDAKTVVDETHSFLLANQPELAEFLAKQPNFASLLYKLGTGEALVPAVGQRVSLRRNTILAKQLDQGGDDVPGGSSQTREEVGAFEAIMSGGEEMSDETLENYFQP